MLSRALVLIGTLVSGTLNGEVQQCKELDSHIAADITGAALVDAVNTLIVLVPVQYVSPGVNDSLLA